MKHACLLVLVAGVSGCASAPSAATESVSDAPVTTEGAPSSTTPVATSGGNVTSVSQQPNTTTTIVSQKGFTLTPQSDPSLCMDIVGAAVDGARLVLNGCNGAASQRFVMENWQLKTIAGKCVSSADDTETNYGENMVVRACDGSVGQNLAMYQGLIYATPSTGWIAVGVQGDDVTANANVVMVQFDSSDAAQHWAFNVTVPTNAGLSVTGFPIAPTGDPNVCLTASGGIVGTAPCASGVEQAWTFDYDGRLHWMGNTQNCLDVNVAADVDISVGTSPALKACDGNDTQTWLLSNGYFVQQNYVMQPNDTPSTTGYTPAVLDVDGYLWSVGRGFVSP